MTRPYLSTHTDHDLPIPEPEHRKPPPDPRERVYVRDVEGNLHGPYARSFAENLRRCHQIKATFADHAELIPTGEPGLRAPRIAGRYVPRRGL
jgi:hypothetical protein